jgi:limonene 1,2-monooxygenase
MRFGMMLAPLHTMLGDDPTVAYRRDVETIKLLEHLDFDEVWIGEHHSAGAETIPDPAIFIAHVAAQTRRIKLGTGVISLPYHNPLWVADRMMFLDHLTQGRIMMGVGPGVLADDARMIGLDQIQSRPRLEQDFDVLMHLLLEDEPISIETDHYKLVNARSQYRPYSDPCFDIAVAAVLSPSGPRLASKHGVGLLSMGATAKDGFDMLALHWDLMEERSPQFGHVADRRKWRLLGLMHIAETREQAIEEVRFGLDAWCEYSSKVIGTPQFRFSAGETFEERIAFVNDSGIGVIGTPDDAIAQIERLQAQSGGFGCYLLLHHEWALPAATRKHYELFARFVKPHFQRTTDRLRDADALARRHQAEYFADQEAALAATIERHKHEQAGQQSPA